MKIKTNKACQMLLEDYDNDNDKVYKYNIKRKLRQKNSEIKIVFKRHVDQMKSEIENVNNIFHSYAFPERIMMLIRNIFLGI